MGVNYESQVYARCDLCGANDACSRCTIAEYKTLLRCEGWSIGKRTLCPKCRQRKIQKKYGGKSDENT